MLWHRQVIFESKGDKWSSSTKCRNWTQGLWNPISSRLNACWAKYYSIIQHWYLFADRHHEMIIFQVLVPYSGSELGHPWACRWPRTIRCQVICRHRDGHWIRYVLKKFWRTKNNYRNFSQTIHHYIFTDQTMLYIKWWPRSCKTLQYFKG